MLDMPLKAPLGDKITIAADPNADAPFATIFFQQAPGAARGAMLCREQACALSSLV